MHRTESSDLIAHVLTRMRKHRMTQRQLAKSIGVSQGHLSKVLRSPSARPTRVIRQLQQWLGETPAEELSDQRPENALVEAAKRAAAGSSDATIMVAELLDLIARLRRTP